MKFTQCKCGLLNLLWVVVLVGTNAAWAAAPSLAGQLTWGRTYTVLDDNNNSIGQGYEFTYSHSYQTKDPAKVLQNPIADTVGGTVVVPNNPASILNGALVSFGQNGNATDYANLRLKTWFKESKHILISVDYTHSSKQAGKACLADIYVGCAGSELNVQRALAALDILKSTELTDYLQPVFTIDNNASFLYGNSMGAMLTVELLSSAPAASLSSIKAAAITAGGIDTKSQAPYSPSGIAGVANITVPLLQIHGLLDRTVPYGNAQAISDAMEVNGQVHQFMSKVAGEHGIQNSSETGDFVVAWLNLYRDNLVPKINQYSKRKLDATTVQMNIYGTGFQTNLFGFSQVKFNATRSVASEWTDIQVKANIPSTDRSGLVSITVPVGPLTNDGSYNVPVGGARSNKVSY